MKRISEKINFLRRKVKCLLGFHEWFDADGWLGEGDRYCSECLKGEVTC